jgi:hypothetical protein
MAVGDRQKRSNPRGSEQLIHVDLAALVGFHESFDSPGAVWGYFHTVRASLKYVLYFNALVLSLRKAS